MENISLGDLDGDDGLMISTSYADTLHLLPAPSGPFDIPPRRSLVRMLPIISSLRFVSVFVRVCSSQGFGM